MEAPPARIRCDICQRTFSKPEHLTRHNLSHEKDRHLRCTHCQKGFYRLDALKRHESIHKEPKRLTLGRGGRACGSCKIARRKCSYRRPCEPCEKRGIECVYVGSSKTRLDASTSDHERTEYTDPGPERDIREPYYSLQDILDRTSRGNKNDRVHEVPTENVFTSPTNVPAISNTELQIPNFDDFNEAARPETPIMSPLWPLGNMSNINWLSNDYLPDFALDSVTRPEIHSNNVHQLPGTPSTSSSMSAGIQATATFSGDHEWQGDQLVPLAIATAMSGGTDSPGTYSSNTTERTNYYYVDSEGARMPRIRTKKARGNSSQVDLELSPKDLQHVSQEIYDKIAHSFNETPMALSLTSMDTTLPPSRELLCHFVNLYFEYFQLVLPFLHPATIHLSECHWLLTLAITAIGAHYTSIEDVNIYAIPLHNALHYAIHEAQNIDSILLTQIKTLNCLGMMYCGDEVLLRSAKRYHGELVSFCDNEWKTHQSDNVMLDPSNDGALETAWRDWSTRESARRTGYCVWLLDCMWVFHFQMRPLMSLHDTFLPMPCPEVLWEATSAKDWYQIYSCSQNPPMSLNKAIQRLYVEKQLQRSTGEFSRILLVHALFHRSWEVESYYSQPLSLWDPTAEKQDVRRIVGLSPIWLPSIPIYSKWRNSACDSLDVLHWHANSVIGAASGMEHPTVLHLHLARVILLTPYKRILSLALHLTGEVVSENVGSTRDYIRRWATEDQYKARLAMIHAGVLFWHVRRYSVDGFYEPSSVFLATLAMWAYGTFAPHTIQNPETREDRAEEVNPASGSDSETERLPTSIQLDRPADDELVQLFVKRGIYMKANIMGVGDLCSTKGPERVLNEGVKLLRGLRSWGFSMKGISILKALSGQS
ncbi:hypothetical protein F5884DRAFT_811368 [Xylogone sp. PMI_703]|nr:hypothetical protein F5884DRAFT_811368 [Xylogone sp. PMI_703]